MKDKLMIVAHPDDESIFGGAALLKEKGWEVICLTNGSDPVRSKEFRKAMNMVGASYEIWNYPDIYEGSFDKQLVAKDIRKRIDKHRYHRIVTHNLCGEYGHSQHKSLSKILHSEGIDNLYVFETGKKIIPFKLIQKKLKLLSIYKSQMFVIEELLPYILYECIVPYSESSCFMGGEPE
ncbi:MAG: PIG-L family deacetylase [Bacillota bacterium]|nr:PIG-L family deacetylase [Bacillota bacterium]MDP4155631.1 PIG-L family deacetylase [Bacillota bacterium]